MPTDIVIPTVGESVTEGVIASWLKQDGDWVEQDETVLELETDKITVELPAPAAGVVKQSAKEGDTVEVGATVGTIDESADKPAEDNKQEAKAEAKPEAEADKSDESEAESETKSDAKSDKSTKTRDTSKSQQAESGEEKQSSQSAAATKEADAKQSGAKQTDAKQSAPSPRVDESTNGDLRATPLAHKMASEYGIDLHDVRPTGPGQRIREQDVLAYVQSNKTVPQDQGAPPTPAQAASRSSNRERMSPLRQRIAARLVEAQQTAAMLTTFNECDMTAVLETRKKYKEDFQKKHEINLGFMGFFVRAACSALRAYPKANASIVDQDGKPAIEHHDYCDVAVAVSTPKGLTVPVIRSAETLSFAQIESTIKDLATRARDGKLELDEITGGTFTITNGGVFGSLQSTPILNPPQSAILGMHAIKNRPVEHPDNPGQIALRPMMYLALSYDHRIVDGSEAVSFLKHIKECIEDPTRLILDL